MSSVRLRLEQREDEWLAPAATRSRGAARPCPEAPSDLRTEFQRDRDRIIHSKAFRRLKYKTQVFLSPTGDHFRTRLTHTLEVTQIARTIARALALNEDLAEAIALGHDLGHTPFGHSGEAALAGVFPGFRHNEQSLRVVDRLENDGTGLNLTNQTRDGILRHSKPVGAITGEAAGRPATPEAQVVKVADGIAYINHDFDDAVRGGMLRPGDLPAIVRQRLGETHAQRIDTLVRDAVETTLPASQHPFSGDNIVALSDEILEAANAMRDFLFARVYAPINAQASTRRAQEIVSSLFNHFMQYPSAVQPDSIPRFDDETWNRHVADVVCGMTDRYAVRCHEWLFHPLAEEL